MCRRHTCKVGALEVVGVVAAITNDTGGAILGYITKALVARS